MRSEKPAKTMNRMAIRRRFEKLLLQLHDHVPTILSNDHVPIRAGARLSDPISPILFSAVLESVIRKCNWEGQRINIDGNMLNHLRFSDDIVVLTHLGEKQSR